MVTLAANLSMMFGEVPFIDRFPAAAEAGFAAVEFLFPYAVPAGQLARIAQANGLTIAIFNTPAGDWDAGERGLAALPDRIPEFRAGVATALEYAGALSCRRVHVMAGKAPRDEMSHDTLVDNVRFAADATAPQGIEVLLEPINTRVDIPGYFYDTSDDAMRIIETVNRPNVKLQYDIYHMQIMEGDLSRTIERLLPSIGHMQLADNPGRNEPGTGEIAFDRLLRHIDSLGYAGFMGCEYKPRGATLEGLDWARDWLRR